MTSFSFQRFWAYLKKETLQGARDPSTFLIAFVLPLMMIFIFGYGVSLDANHVPLGLVVEDRSPTARSLENAFLATPFFKVTTSDSRPFLEEALTGGSLRGVVVIPQDFSKNLLAKNPATVQVMLDGSEPNPARFVLNYAQGVVRSWNQPLKTEGFETITLPLQPEPRVWFNQELRSRETLLPGSVAIIMSLIGILLTALVIAREWERGTMETLFSTPILIKELFLAKLIPYFLLGLGSMALCVFISITLFQVPFRGSFGILLLSTSIFLLASLGQGLLISINARNQFLASQISIVVGFLPAFILSGFLFEIESMPWPIQIITYLLPPRYFVTILKSSFLSGTVWELVLPNLLALAVMASFFLTVSIFRIKRRID